MLEAVRALDELREGGAPNARVNVRMLVGNGGTSSNKALLNGHAMEDDGGTSSDDEERPKPKYTEVSVTSIVPSTFHPHGPSCLFGSVNPVC